MCTAATRLCKSEFCGIWLGTTSTSDRNIKEKENGHSGYSKVDDFVWLRLCSTTVVMANAMA